jgi:hypothetical protein
MRKRKLFSFEIKHTLVVSTPFEIKLSAKGAAIDVMIIEPKEGKIDTCAIEI